MPIAQIEGLRIAYDVVGEGDPWVLTPGGRFSKDTPGLHELAATLAGTGKRVLVWDRPNTGASDVCFAGSSESAMQADVLAGLLRQLDLAPAVIAGGRAGHACRCSRRSATATWPGRWPCGGSAAAPTAS